MRLKGGRLRTGSWCAAGFVPGMRRWARKRRWIRWTAHRGQHPRGCADGQKVRIAGKASQPGRYPRRPVLVAPINRIPDWSRRRRTKAEETVGRAKRQGGAPAFEYMKGFSWNSEGTSLGGYGKSPFELVKAKRREESFMNMDRLTESDGLKGGAGGGHQADTSR